MSSACKILSFDVERLSHKRKLDQLEIKERVMALHMKKAEIQYKKV
jgi:hypothetical protein